MYRNEIIRQTIKCWIHWNKTIVRLCEVNILLLYILRCMEGNRPWEAGKARQGPPDTEVQRHAQQQLDERGSAGACCGVHHATWIWGYGSSRNVMVTFGGKDFWYTCGFLFIKNDSLNIWLFWLKFRKEKLFLEIKYCDEDPRLTLLVSPCEDKIPKTKNQKKKKIVLFVVFLPLLMF